METKTELIQHNNAKIEIGTIIHNGHEFKNLGSIINHDNGYVVGYVRGNTLVTWESQKISDLKEISSYPVNSYFSNKMHNYRTIIEGKQYYGRGLGEGMILKLRISKGK